MRLFDSDQRAGSAVMVALEVQRPALRVLETVDTIVIVVFVVVEAALQRSTVCRIPVDRPQK